MAKGPLRKCHTHTMYFINGYRFQTEERSSGRATYNSGVCVESEYEEYFGRIKEINEIEYPGVPI